MSQVAPHIKELNKERLLIQRNQIPGVTIKWPDNDLTVWMVDIEGPAGSYYEDDIITVQIMFGSDWPEKAPRVRVLTPVYHPNIDGQAICVDILRGEYHKGVHVSDIIKGIINALKHPNPSDPVNIPVSLVQKESEELFAERARAQAAANILARDSGAPLKAIH